MASWLKLYKGHQMLIDNEGYWQFYTDTLPEGATPLGVVTVNGCKGALAYLKSTRKYIQVNNGVVRNLDGRSVAGVLGISGRPPTQGGKRINVFLNKTTIEKAKKIGDGNLSSGIRKAVAAMDNK